MNGNKRTALINLYITKADKLDKNRKIKMKFWVLMKIIRGKRYSIRLENEDFAYYSCRMYEGWYNKFWKEHKNEL